MSDSQKAPILIVDDEPEILFSLRGLLRREFELHTAETGKEALDILAKHPIHVIMTDQRMPEMTGTELIGRIKTEYPDAIRIIFTGYTDIKAVVEAINTGGLYRFLTKPWDPDELVKVLHDAAAKFAEQVEHRKLLHDMSEYLAKDRQLLQEFESDGQNITPSLQPKLGDQIQLSTELAERIEKLSDGKDAGMSDSE